MSSPAAMDIVQEKRFLVRSSSLKDIRSFAREVFDKLSLSNEIKEEIVLAIAEAAQNIVKNAYKDFPDTDDKMLLQIKCNNGKLEIGFFDMGRPVDPTKVKHREIDNVKPGGLGTFFIQEIMDSIDFKDGGKSWINHLLLTKQL